MFLCILYLPRVNISHKMIPNDQLKKKNSHKNKSESTVVGLGPLLPSIKWVHLYVKFNW